MLYLSAVDIIYLVVGFCFGVIIWEVVNNGK